MGKCFLILSFTGFKIISLLLVIMPELTFAAPDTDHFRQNVKSFNKINYNAARQNWSVSASPNGFVYFANHQGLLEFDGTTWNLYSLPNETILRAVKVKNDSVIYTSGYMELGYWKPDQYGTLHYFSLYEKAKKYLFKNIEFWNIAVAGSYVYFQSFNRILAYNSDTVSVVELSPFISVMNQVNNKVLVAVRDIGIFEIVGTSAIPYLSGDFFNNKLVQIGRASCRERV